MRFLPTFITLALAVGLPAVARAADEATGPAIVRVFSGWRAGDSFKRIAEYFDGKEHPGNETILRTHPGQRTGYYFLVRMKNPGAPRPVRFQLELVEPGSGASRTVALPAELGTGSTVYQLGLTGPEWQDAKVQPMAWHLRVLGESDQVLASEKSYLWEKPAAK